MRTRSLRRLAAAVLNLLFLLAWEVPAMLPPCPTHDGISAVSHDAHADMATMSGHSAHASSPAAAHAMPALAQHDGAPAAEHSCRCIGQCCTTAIVVAPTAQAIRWQIVVRRLVEPPAAEPTLPTAATPRLLPFSNGPPITA